MYAYVVYTINANNLNRLVRMKGEKTIVNTQLVCMCCHIMCIFHSGWRTCAKCQAVVKNNATSKCTVCGEPLAPGKRKQRVLRQNDLMDKRPKTAINYNGLTKTGKYQH